MPLFFTCSAASGRKTLIVPDKDADGLTSGVIIHRTLALLGLDPSLIETHLIEKGSSIHSEVERVKMADHSPDYIFILDQGSRRAPPVIDAPHKALLIDHHHVDNDDFPAGAQWINACHYPPVATSSLLTYKICSSLHDEVASQTAWLCAIGTHGDLGNTLKWEPPFPDMKETFKQHTKKSINDAVSLLNAPRRTAAYDVISAWNAVLGATSPSSILKNPRLLDARYEVNQEVERCTHTAPKFSHDARIAVFRISSAAQIHPVIATRWAGHLKSKNLEVVMVANSGYLPGKINFSCRIPKCARGKDPPVNIIRTLKEIAGQAEREDLIQRLGESFARGHKEASGGIVGVEEFEEYLRVLRIGEKPARASDQGGNDASPKKEKGSPQKNTLMNYFHRGG